MWRELREGLEYLVRHRYWRPISITTASSNFFWTLCGSIIIVYAVRELDLSPAVIGLTFSLGSIGGLARRVHRQARVGAVRRRPDDRRLGGPVRPGADAGAAGPAVLPDPAARRVLHPRRGRGRALQHQRHQPHADAHARAVARPAQRLAAVHRLGHDPARVARRRRPRLASSACTRRSGWGRSAHRVCFLPVALSPLRHIHEMPTESEQDPSVPLGPPGTCQRGRRCLSYRRWRPGCASSTRSSRLARSSRPARRTSRP